MLKAYAGKEIDDPEKIAEVIVDLTNRDKVPADLLIGSDALHIFNEAEEKRRKEFAKWIDVTTSTDFADNDLGFLAQLRQA